MLEGLRGEVSIAELCRKEGINQNLHYRCSKVSVEQSLDSNRNAIVHCSHSLSYVG